MNWLKIVYSEAGGSWFCFGKKLMSSWKGLWDKNNQAITSGGPSELRVLFSQNCYRENKNLGTNWYSSMCFKTSNDMITIHLFVLFHLLDIFFLFWGFHFQIPSSPYYDVVIISPDAPLLYPKVYTCSVTEMHRNTLAHMHRHAHMLTPTKTCKQAHTHT